MNDEDESKGKILRGTEGIGNVTPEMIDERAREIARADGRESANDLDRSRARDDFIGSTPAPEKPEEPVEDWYTPRGSSGRKTLTVRPEDEENIPDKLIREGVEEADHDQRSQSAGSSET
ncbi:MAG TPA: hypothetical protein VFA51_02355 [Candidatus Udaeobacter sp.]|nr:hypothetical protein [Candidatus Udaeobacter sp.]